HRSSISLSFLMPAKIIFVPGTLARGSLMYSLNAASPHVMPELLLASLYVYPSTVPDFRPSNPFNSGPTLFAAPSPTAWHGAHLRNDVSPAATSCASAADPEMPRYSAANTRPLMAGSPSGVPFIGRHHRPGPSQDGRPG